MLGLKGERGNWVGFTPLSKIEKHLIKNDPVERAAVEPSNLLFSSNTPEFQILPHHLNFPKRYQRSVHEDLSKKAHYKAQEKVRDLSGMNISVQHSLDTLGKYCKDIYDEKEKEITRYYRDKLNEVQKEIDRLKNRTPEFDARYWNQKYRDVERGFLRMTDEANKLDAMIKESESSIKESKQELVKIKKECVVLNRQLLAAKKEVLKIKNASISKASSSSAFSTQSAPHYSTRSSVSVSHYSALYSKKAPYSSSFSASSSGRVPPLTLSSMSSDNDLSGPFITAPIDTSPTVSSTSSSSSASPTTTTTLSPGEDRRLSSFRTSDNTNRFLASLYSLSAPPARPRPLKNLVVSKPRSQIKPVRPVIESRTIRILAQSNDADIVGALNHLRHEHAFLEDRVEKAHGAFEVVERAKRGTQRENTEARAFLQDCLDDVAKETNVISSSNISFDKQRELLSLQTSRQKVLIMLRDKTFPPFTKTVEKMVTITDGAGDDVYFQRGFDTERMNAAEGGGTEIEKTEE